MSLIIVFVQLLPENIFVVASCNPHRGDSLASHVKDISWLKTTYYVHKLHPTLRYVMWDYGALDEDQERQYINAKLEMLNENLAENKELAELILKSQKKMREYATKQLVKLGNESIDAEVHAKSTVSQRDIQRVFTFYSWFYKLYNHTERHSIDSRHRRAIMVALSLVYYMRLNENFRRQYVKFIDEEMITTEGDVSFKKSLDDELNWFINQIKPPPGIAKTTALKENVFAIISCTITRTPLIIVGDPGSSKTMSFNLVVSKLKGKESEKSSAFHDTKIFEALDPHFYQCSRRTTSSEVEKVFNRAINRQDTVSSKSFPMVCVVFMDEAGLPEEQLESLKVLHQYLDNPKVSFVAISNDILDAAKTNRAVSLFRPKADDDELMILAKGVITNEEKKLSKDETKLIEVLCRAYKSTLSFDKTLAQMFGLRDFMYFVVYLRQNRPESCGITPQLILRSLERNFNGTKLFSRLCEIFLNAVSSILAQIY